ncbi:hypothetical protein C3943_08850 [Lysinibacillus sp. B2A1]|nr:hypothetical protein C3943_08850 [Lysinibacillus sp. B2A1]
MSCECIGTSYLYPSIIFLDIKMLGTVFAAVGFYMYFRTPLITIISLATLFYDGLYIVLIYRLYRKKTFFPKQGNK